MHCQRRFTGCYRGARDLVSPWVMTTTEHHSAWVKFYEWVGRIAFGFSVVIIVAYIAARLGFSVPCGPPVEWWNVALGVIDDPLLSTPHFTLKA
jgi:hypothetical protein